MAPVSCHRPHSLSVSITAVNSELKLPKLVVVLSVFCVRPFLQLVSRPVQLSVVVYLVLCKDSKWRSAQVLSVGLMPLQVMNRPWMWSMTLI